MEKKKKKRKLKITRVLFVLLLIYLIIHFFWDSNYLKIKNIYIYDNNYITDQKVLELAGIENHPNFYTTTKSSIKRKILMNPYIKNIKVDKKFFNQIHIYVEEYKWLFYKRNDKKLVLESKEELVMDREITNAPILTNYVNEDFYNEFIEKMMLIDSKILNKISEIEYSPNEVDKKRFLLYMNDRNYVYLTLSRFDKINKYDEILPELEGKRGILYLDLGDYFEILK
ncbi:MAG: FtsQ-type POTRA domain-containing protein [Bacilli bacterium]